VAESSKHNRKLERQSERLCHRTPACPTSLVAHLVGWCARRHTPMRHTCSTASRPPNFTRANPPVPAPFPFFRALPDIPPSQLVDVVASRTAQGNGMFQRVIPVAHLATTSPFPTTTASFGASDISGQDCSATRGANWMGATGPRGGKVCAVNEDARVSAWSKLCVGCWCHL
jgi:hypothetical protein